MAADLQVMAGSIVQLQYKIYITKKKNSDFLRIVFML
jgi:hypothetical protein